MNKLSINIFCHIQYIKYIVHCSHRNAGIYDYLNGAGNHQHRLVWCSMVSHCDFPLEAVSSRATHLTASMASASLVLVAGTVPPN